MNNHNGRRSERTPSTMIRLFFESLLTVPRPQVFKSVKLRLRRNRAVEAGLPRFEYSGALNLAELYKIKGDYNLADRYATIAMSLAQQYGYQDIGQINLIFSVIAMGKDDPVGTAEYALKAIDALKNTISLPKASEWYW